MRHSQGYLCLLPLLAILAPFAGCGGSDDTGSSSAQSSTGMPPPETVDDIMGNLPQSCSFGCGACDEPGTPFSCPTVKPWAALPHDAACGSFDGTHPAPS